MTSEERRAVGHRIRALRERKGWGRGELARRLGVHAGSIARWETGGALPHAYTIERLAELAGTTAEWLRTGTAGGGAAAPRARPDGGSSFPTFEVMRGFVAGIAAPGEERLRKLDALEGLRRMLTARGLLPEWWYALWDQVERGEL
jgi:transcriptional regulator with XRE-family HTH domain